MVKHREFTSLLMVTRKVSFKTDDLPRLHLLTAMMKSKLIVIIT